MRRFRVTFQHVNEVFFEIDDEEHNRDRVIEDARRLWMHWARPAIKSVEMWEITNEDNQPR